LTAFPPELVFIHFRPPTGAARFPASFRPEKRVGSSPRRPRRKENVGQNLRGRDPLGFLIDGDGKIRNTWHKIAPENTAPEVMKALEG
jgi:peroxiredoxin